MILFTNDKTQIEYHKEEGLLEVRWIGKVQLHEFTFVWEKLLKYIIKYKAKYLLLDASNLQSSTVLNDPPFIHLFQTELPGTSLEKIARVASESGEDNEKVDKTFKNLADNQLLKFQFQQFSHHYEAMEWLLEKSI